MTRAAARQHSPCGVLLLCVLWLATASAFLHTCSTPASIRLGPSTCRVERVASTPFLRVSATHVALACETQPVQSYHHFDNHQRGHHQHFGATLQDQFRLASPPAFRLASSPASPRSSNVSRDSRPPTPKGLRQFATPKRRKTLGERSRGTGASRASALALQERRLQMQMSAYTMAPAPAFFGFSLERSDSPRLLSDTMRMCTVLLAFALLILSRPFLAEFRVFEGLVAHGCSGALGGLAAVFGDAALTATVERPKEPWNRWRESRCIHAWKRGFRRRWESTMRENCIKITAITRSVNAMTYFYIKQAMSTLAISASFQTILAAAGTGVVATMVQTSLCKQNTTLFQKKIARNILVFEAFWLTYATICALSPAISVSYLGLAISGALGGVASSLAGTIKLSSLLQPFRGGMSFKLKRLRVGWRSMSKLDAVNGREFRAAYQMAILNVVYMAVFWTLELQFI